jgi:hypothetical protein
VTSAAKTHPAATRPRGAFGAVGMHLADLLTGAAYPGDELIVCTMAGDVIVYSADSMTERWRTHVHGAAGFYNAIRAENLDPQADTLKELYIAGSYGLWRFIQPGE